MANNTHGEARERRGVRHWLGLGRGAEDEGPVPPAATPPPADEEAAEDRRSSRRRQLVTDIGSFLISHRLEVTSRSLSLAHGVISGGDERLALLIETRVAGREPVTLQWLEQSAGSPEESHAEKGQALLEGLMGRLQSSIDEFSTTTVAARSATTEYNSALQAQVEVLDEVNKAGSMITELAGIARDMLDRTREIEAAMERSESQTQVLRENLEQARRDASRDHLTGLPNRRAFEAVFASEHAAAKAAGDALCVAFCDIDRFKRVNDTHGHAAGDRVLKAVAQTLAGISNDRCHVARHGGEEFVVLLRGKTLADAWAVLDGAREAMASRRLVNRSTEMAFGQVTFSGGIADVFASREPRDALAAADAALYRAKEEGRNRIYRHGEQALEAAA